MNADLYITLIIILLVTLLVVSLYFILELKKLKEEMLEQKEIADRAKTTLGQREKFLAYTNHEIRTPLNAVSGSAELLARTDLDKNQTKYVQTIRASVDNVLVLVNDVLDLSRIESGKVKFRSEDFLLSDILNGVKYILREKVEKKGIKLFVELDPAIPPVLKGDPRYLNQILINLCNNAVKFTDLGKVTLIAELRETENKDEGNTQTVPVRFRIVDTGKGIRKSKLSTIFDQFEQETRHTIQHKGGSGLGLAITRQLVEGQNGKIFVESKYLEGTTFTVELDYQKGVIRKGQPTEQSVEVLNGLCIIIVDDNHLNREIVEDVLKELNPNIEAICLENGEKTIQYLSENDADIVLMDIQMPQMDGFELAKYIRTNIRHPMNEIPIIAMTAYAMENVAESCFKAGMNDYITKPISWQFLLTKIQRIRQKHENKEVSNLRFEHIDLGNLKRLTAGSNAKMFKYIDIFLHNVPKDSEVMMDNINKGNYDAAMEQLHKIKGNMVYMGNKEVAGIYDNLTAVENPENHWKDFEKVKSIVEKTTEEIKIIKKNYKLLFLNINS